MRTRRPRRIDERAHEAIRDLAKKGWRNAAEVRRELERRPRSDVGVIPTERTVRRILRDLVPGSESSTWNAADAGHHEAALVLPVLSAVIEESEGRRRDITPDEAKWIAKIREIDLAEPGQRLDYLTVYELAFDAATDPLGAVAKRIDEFLSFAPWRDKEHEARYHAAIEKGWLGHRPMVLPRLYFTIERPFPLPAGTIARGI